MSAEDSYTQMHERRESEGTMRDPLDIKCPHCGARVGDVCRTPSGGKLTRPRKGDERSEHQPPRPHRRSSATGDPLAPFA